MASARILIADDEAAIRQSVGSILRYDDYEVLEASDGPLALEALRRESVDALLLDVKMPGMDGFEVMAQLEEEGIQVPILVISGHDAVSTAVEAIRRGALDFLEKPFKKEELLVRVQNAVAHGRLRRENAALRAANEGEDQLLGSSPALREIHALIEKVAPTPARVLIVGENGTGKELVARALHQRSTRAAGPFIEVNCAAIPEELIESELFGHERGSFTGAAQRRIGKFERANGGTLFLDEIGDMSPGAQAKVLRALQEHRFERVGGHQSIHVDVRVLAATNRDLQEPSLGFRQDLYFRLNVIQIRLPPLRERREDIPVLLGHFLELSAQEMKQPVKVVEAAALERLLLYDWPGNVRELRNLAERLSIVAPAGGIRVADLPAPLGASGGQAPAGALLDCGTFNEFKALSESVFLQHKLRQYQYNISRTADELQMQRSNLYKKIQRYGLRTHPDGG